MLEEGIAKTQEDYRVMRRDVDRMIRRGNLGTDIQRLVSQISLHTKQYFTALIERHNQLKDYVSAVPSHFKHCETVFQNIYLEMYNLMGKTEQGIVAIDGHSRNSIPIDPNSVLNLVQSGPVCIDLVLENESVLKYPPSVLKYDLVNEKMISLEAYYNKEVDAIYERLILPDFDEAQIVELLSLLETDFILIRSALAKLMKEQNKREWTDAEGRREGGEGGGGEEEQQEEEEEDCPIQKTCQLCTRIITALQSFLTLIRREEQNVHVHRDNVAVKFIACTDLYHKMTKIYYITQATKASTHVKPLF
jgi:hypothetical protein